MAAIETRGLGPRTRVDDAAARAIAVAVAEVRRYEPVLLDGGEPDPDDIHDMRVAVRRLRAVLGLLGGEHLHAVELEVKRLQDALGEVRDLQVRRAWLVARKGKAALPRLVRQVEQDIPHRVRELRRAIARWGDITVPDLMQAASGLHEGGRLGGHRLREKLADRLSTLSGRLRAFLTSDDAATAHALRIAVKKTRYDAELLSPALGKAARKVVSSVTPLQETLGDLHDADVRLVWLEDLAAAARPDIRAAALALLEEVREERTRLAETLVDRLSAWRKNHTTRRHRRRLLH